MLDSLEKLIIQTHLVELLEEYIINNFVYDDYIITYIPMSKKSKRKRGFNQCEYIAKKIAYNLNIPCKKILNKKRENKEQKRLKYNERRNKKASEKLKQ